MINIPIATASATSSSALDLDSLEIEVAADMAKQYLKDITDNATLTMRVAAVLAEVPQYASWDYSQIIASETAMAAIAASDTAMTAVVASDVALCAIAKTAATTPIITFFKALNAKVSHLQAAYDTITGSDLFALKVAKSYDSVSILNQYGTTSYAGKAIILTATGTYSNQSAYTIVSINGTQVSTNKLVNTLRPSTVIRDNIGAISVPTTTWTESGNAYAAIAVYTAK